MDIQSLYEKFLECGTVSTDTRKIVPGSVFFALKGPNFNANAFAQEALRKGARYAIVDEREFVKDEPRDLSASPSPSFVDLAKFSSAL